jgi:Melibiase
LDENKNTTLEVQEYWQRGKQKWIESRGNMTTSQQQQQHRTFTEDEKWIFSVPLPASVISLSNLNRNHFELITTHHKIHETPSQYNLHQQHQQQDDKDDINAIHGGGDDDADDDDEGKVTETKSLLDAADDDQLQNVQLGGVGDGGDGALSQPLSHPPYCWRFYSPVYGMELQSSTLLRLSYRPAWQGIPEYTKNKRQRSLYRAIASCCCPTDEEDLDDEEQVWEVYTTKHIRRIEKIDDLKIRGMGQCQAVQLYLKTLSNANVDHMATPRKYQTALNMHRQRAEGQNVNPWTRFTCPGDTLKSQQGAQTSGAANEDDKDNMIVVTFAVPVSTEGQHDPPLLWKVDIPPQRSGHDYVLDNITVLDGSVDLHEPSTHVFINGYQSWSYTGSVWKGQKQPQPAMMDVFSKAFNLGGCLPDLPTTVVGCHPDLLCTPTAGNVGASQANLMANISTSNVSTDTRTSSLRSVSPATKGTYQTPPEWNSSPSQGSLRILSNPKGFPYKSDFFACVTTGRDEIMDEDGGPALICGWLSQHQQFGVVAIDESLQNMTMTLTHQAIPKSRVVTDWAFAQLVSPHHYDEECMVHFLHAAAAYNQAKPLQNGPLLTGWCSWYHYYENISEENLRSNFGKLASMKDKVPTNVAVVDDGYMTAWGDWNSLKPKKFTDMSVVASDIASSRMRPGLWLAPFAADKHSKIARDHPEWIIRNDRGVPANSSNCGKFFYGLDATNPQVRKHAFKAIRRAVQDWGFQVLKIDFLYAACLEGNGKYDMSMTRAEAMHLAIQCIREAAGPDVFLIGCGCPIGTAIGYVDGMRVSADTGPTWYPSMPLPWWDHGTLPSVRAMIRNSMSRASMGHRWWLNDPDCLLLRESTSLTDEEVRSAASIIAMTCGMMLISDDLTKVSLSRIKLLTQIFPMTGVSAVVLDLHTTKNKGMPSLLRLWCTDRYGRSEAFRQSNEYFESVESEDFNAEATYFGRSSAFNFETSRPSAHERHRSCIHVANGLGTWTVISVSNWDDKPQIMQIPRLAIYSPPETGWEAREDIPASTTDASNEDDESSAGYHVFSFWSSRYSWLSLTPPSESSNSSHPISRRLQSHDTEIFHIRKVIPGKPQYVGSDLHFSCGHEVLNFDATEQNRVTICLKTELARVGHIFLFIPVVDTSHVQCFMAGTPCRWSVFGNVPDEDGTARCCGRIIRVMVIIHADKSERDGQVAVEF